LLDTVASILEGDERPSEIIIVDQSDTPHPTLANLTGTAACAIRYLWVHSRGVASARNRTIAVARHEICVLIDDDMFVAADWLGTLVRALVQAGPKAVVTGQVSEAVEKSSGFAPSLNTKSTSVVYEGRIDDDVLYTGNMAIYRATVEDLGWFDERLGAGGRFPAAYDNDFGYRLLKAGYRIYYVPEAVVYHRAWRTKDNYYPLRWSYGRGQGGMLAKHISLGDSHMLRRAVKILGQRLFWIPFLVRRQRLKAYGDLVYAAGFISGLVEWLLTETKIGIPNKITVRSPFHIQVVGELNESTRTGSMAC
jgi:GT2 family glycosyltransferase